MNKSRKKFLKRVEEQAKIKKIAQEAIQETQTVEAPHQAKSIADSIFNKVLSEAIDEMLDAVEGGKIKLD